MQAPKPIASLNVLGEPLSPCSTDPMTGFFRDGCCNTCKEDVGIHSVCVEVDSAFLQFSKAEGNDLITPRLEWGFPGLKPTGGVSVQDVGWRRIAKGRLHPFS